MECFCSTEWQCFIHSFHLLSVVTECRCISAFVVFVSFSLSFLIPVTTRRYPSRIFFKITNGLILFLAYIQISCIYAGWITAEEHACRQLMYNDVCYSKVHNVLQFECQNITSVTQMILCTSHQHIPADFFPVEHIRLTFQLAIFFGGQKSRGG